MDSANEACSWFFSITTPPHQFPTLLVSVSDPMWSKDECDHFSAHILTDPMPAHLAEMSLPQATSSLGSNEFTGHRSKSLWVPMNARL